MGYGHAQQKFSPHCAKGTLGMHLGYLQTWPRGGWHNEYVEGTKVLETLSQMRLTEELWNFFFFEMTIFSLAMVSESK